MKTEIVSIFCVAALLASCSRSEKAQPAATDTIAVVTEVVEEAPRAPQYLAARCAGIIERLERGDKSDLVLKEALEQYIALRTLLGPDSIEAMKAKENVQSQEFTVYTMLEKHLGSMMKGKNVAEEAQAKYDELMNGK